MSLAVKCDRCGNLIANGSTENKEYFDAAVLISGDPMVEYEDLCPSCMMRLKSVLSGFAAEDDPVVDSDATAVEGGNDEVETEEPAERPQTPSPVARAEGFEAYAERDESDMANAVVKSFPAPKRESHGNGPK